MAIALERGVTLFQTIFLTLLAISKYYQKDSRIQKMAFEKDNYYKEKFEKLDLNGQTFSDKEFEECKFVNSSFVNVKFVRCRFVGCVFEGSVISAMITTDSNFVDVYFKNSKVIGTDWTKAQRLQDLSFNNSQINYSNFRLLKLPKIKMLSCEAKEVDFTGTDLSEAVITSCDLENAVFSQTNLAKADLRYSKNYFIDPRFNTVKKAKFSMPEAMTLLSGLEIEIDL